MVELFYVLAVAGAAYAQQVYSSVQGPAPRCSRSNFGEAEFFAQATPSPRLSKFSFTQTATIRTATSASAGTKTAYASSYEHLQSLMPELSATSWGSWDPSAIARPTDLGDPYGQAAWSSLWERASLANFTTRGLYSVLLPDSDSLQIINTDRIP